MKFSNNLNGKIMHYVTGCCNKKICKLHNQRLAIQPPNQQPESYLYIAVALGLATGDYN